MTTKTKTKKVLKVLGLGLLGALAGVAIYDHRQKIVSGAKNAASWIKTKATLLASLKK